MRATGWRRFRFSKADLGGDHGLRITVLPYEAGLWWRALLTCRAQDRRWALRQVSGGDKRFAALAVEHRDARKAGRAPDPEVPGIGPGAVWQYVRFSARTLAAGSVVTAGIVGAAGVLLAMLTAVGVVDVEVSWR